ncbi:MAG: hypothetical protein GDA56_09275 [Hormoscilla sp. GM7CHS1pb]|nr:hypothetical protein [Hormoscilla sp. GM7CHS1pb]
MSNSTNQLPSSFLEKALQLGHDPEVIKATGIEYQLKQVENPDGIRKLLLPMNDDLREWLRQSLRKDRQRLPYTDNVHFMIWHIVGGMGMSKHQHEEMNAFFPRKVETLSMTDKVLGPGEVWDVTPDDTAAPAIINLNKLTMKAGSKIVCRAAQLDMQVQELIKDGSSADEDTDNQDIHRLGDINIVGETPKKAQNGGGGADRGSANDGTNASCGGMAHCTTYATPGSNGDNGGNGDHGDTGADGLEAVYSRIKVHRIELQNGGSNLFVYTRGGDGGDGGDGGKGGNGGDGGKGGNSSACGCTTCSAKDGGDGGNGGKGGNGGDGGNGGRAMDITVEIAQGYRHLVEGRSDASQPGVGGEAGGAGGPGKAGEGGSANGKNTSGAQAGSSGEPGEPGNPGNRGALGGSAGQIEIREF